MEDAILKYAEFGILGVVVLLLLTKGLGALNELAKTTATLSDSQKALADSVGKLADKVADFGARMNTFSFQITGIENRLDKLEETNKQNFNELRHLIKKRD